MTAESITEDPVNVSAASRITIEPKDYALAAAIFLSALLLRLIYLTQAWEIPFFEHPIVDGLSYHEWAMRIAAGDWIGDRVFYQAPAYPYFLALVYRVVGVEPWPVHVTQMVMGAGSCALLFLATRMLFAEIGVGPSRVAAVVSGAGLALYAPALFFDSLTQKAVLALFLATLWLCSLARLQASPGVARAIASGAVLGLLALTRENMLSFAAIVPVWLFLQGRRAASPGQGLVTAAAFVLGVVLLLAPVSIRNDWVGGVFAPTTSQMGPNFYMGNNPDATGLYRPLIPGRQTPEFEGSDARLIAERRLGRELDPGEVSSYWMGESIHYIQSQPLRWLDTMVFKLFLTLNRVEIPDSEDVYVYAEYSSLLRGLLVLFHFGTLLPLAAAGLWIAWRESIRGAALLALIVATFVVTTAAFYVFARYRFPLVPMLLPFAGLGVSRLPALWRAGARSTALGACAAALLGLGVAFLPLIDVEPYKVGALTNMGNVMYNQKRYVDAERFYEQALAVNPDNADLHLHFAALRLQQRRLPEAEQHLRRMLALDEKDLRGHSMLASLLDRQGRRAEAAKHRRRAAMLNPERQTTGAQGTHESNPSGLGRIAR